MNAAPPSLTITLKEISTAHKPAVNHRYSEEITMTRHTFYTALLALFVGGSAVVPLQAQTQELEAALRRFEAQGVPVIETDEAPARFGEPVTVQVTNNNWLDLRIYVVETLTSRRRWHIGNVTGKSTASLEIPDHLDADLGNLILVAESIGSRPQLRTERLQTWPGALVDWSIGAHLGLSFVTIS